jgi:agmatinase
MVSGVVDPRSFGVQGTRMRPFRPGDAGYVGPGITFLRTPLVLDPDELDGTDVAILGAPFDDGVTYRPGTRFGPRAIRLVDRGGVGGRTHMEVGVDPKAILNIVDFGDIEAPPGDLLTSHALLREGVRTIIEKGAIPVVLGGDHSLSAPMMQAIADCYGPDGYAVIHFDTHADTGFLDEPTPYNHGTPFYRGVAEGFMRGDHIFQIGLRGTWPSPVEFDWMRTVGFHWRTMTEVMELGLNAVVDEATAYATSKAPRVYLTVDIDVLDPAFAPGTGTPEPGGLMTRELLSAVRTIASSVDICAMDLVEVSPPYDVAELTAMAAHRVVLEAITGIARYRAGSSAGPQRSHVVDYAH